MVGDMDDSPGGVACGYIIVIGKCEACLLLTSLVSMLAALSVYALWLRARSRVVCAVFGAVDSQGESETIRSRRYGRQKPKAAKYQRCMQRQSSGLSLTDVQGLAPCPYPPPVALQLVGIALQLNPAVVQVSSQQTHSLQYYLA